MSPEQARGQTVDARTDVWAFGCVLYEMLVGRSAFGAATVSDTIANVLEHDPDWQAIPPSTPSGLQRLLRRCLAQDPKRRIHAIADVNFDLQEVHVETEQRRGTAVQARTRGAWSVALAIVVVALTAAGWQMWSRRSANLPPPRVMPLTSYFGIEASPTLSPDGKQVAFSWDGETGQNEDIHVVMVGADNPLAITSDPAETLHRPGDLTAARSRSLAWTPVARRSTWSRRSVVRKRSSRVSRRFHLGSAPLELTDPGLAWSRDGRWLAVANVTSGDEQGVFLVAQDGRHELLLKAKPGDDYRMAAFSPTGAELGLINGATINDSIVGTNQPNNVRAN